MNTRDVISGLAQKLRPFFQQPAVQLVVIFGSVVSGKVHRSSDLDLAILADEPLDTVQITSELIRLLHINNIDVVDLRRANPLLAREVVRQGTVLHERDSGTYARFVSLAVRRYADTRKLREAHKQVVNQFLQTRGVR
ncbi:MAG: nucleotidyltransferase domain-containing protein [Nitrospirae bacterium]|nr:nucleotidyltransferase domain-containing protein [Nitrospirota bacterium]